MSENYCFQIFKNKHGVGTPAAQDVDGDGNVEFFIPDGRGIHVMKYGVMKYGQLEFNVNLLSSCSASRLLWKVKMFYSQNLFPTGFAVILL